MLHKISNKHHLSRLAQGQGGRMHPAVRIPGGCDELCDRRSGRHAPLDGHVLRRPGSAASAGHSGRAPDLEVRGESIS